MKSPEEIEWFLEDLFLGSQWSIILGYRRLPDGGSGSLLLFLTVWHIIIFFPLHSGF